MPFRRIHERRRRESAAHTLYASAVEQSRRPDFYSRLGVPDTLDGRFELVVMHAFLLMHRLKAVGHSQADREAQALSQAVFDLMFADMDMNLREIGVSDLAVGKKVRQMAKAFYGRVAAYEQGLAAEAGVLEDAVRRNLYGTVQADPAHLSTMAHYLRSQVAHLAAQGEAGLLEGRVSFLQSEDMP